MGKDQENREPNEAMKEKFRRNVEMIREILPDFRFSEEQMKKYLTPERIKLHERAAAYEKKAGELQEEARNFRVPTSYARSLYTFCDQGDTPEAKEKNQRILRNVGAPTQAGAQLRKRFFVDSVNAFQEFDFSGFDVRRSFEETANFALDHADLCERGFEFGNMNANRSASMGFTFSAEREETIRHIGNNATEYGGKGFSLLRLMQSDLFLCFPYEDLTAEQSILLLSTMQSRLMKKGIPPQEAAQYTDLLGNIINIKKERTIEPYEKFTCLEEDAADTVPSAAELKQRVAGLYTRLIAASSGKERIGQSDFSVMMDRLGTASGELANLKGPASPEQTACLKKAMDDLADAVLRYRQDPEKAETDDAEKIRQDLARQLEELLNPNMTDTLLFETAVNGYNTALGQEEDAAFFAASEKMTGQIEESGLSYEQIRQNASALGMPVTEYVKRASDKTIAWENPAYKTAEIRAKYEAETAKKQTDEIKSRFGLGNEYTALFKDTGISAEELEELPFLKELPTREAKNAALRKYLEDGKKYAGGTLPQEYAEALAEEGLSYADVWGLALRQGITIDAYFNRMLGKEELPIDREHRRETEEEQIDRVLGEINRQIRDNAKNPLESAMAETVIAMKERSFHLGSRFDMEKSVARYVALKAIQRHLDLKKGQTLENDPEKAAELERFLGGLEKHTQDVYENDTFRYLIRTVGTEKLAEMSRGTSMEELDAFYGSLKDLIRDDSVHKDPFTRVDKLLTYADYGSCTENFFPDKYSFSGTMINAIPNPFHISASRKGLTTLACGRMAQKGFEIGEIFDPYKLRSAKLAIGEEAYDMIQHEENRDEVVGAYLAGMEKMLAYADDTFARLEALTPEALVKLDDPLVFTVFVSLQDAEQELEKMDRMVPFSPKNKARFEELYKRQTLVTKEMGDLRLACEHALDMVRNPDTHHTADGRLMAFTNLACLNASYENTKRKAEESGLPYSSYIAAEHAAAPEDPLSAHQMISNSNVAASNFVMKKVPKQVKETIENNKKVRVQIAQDVIKGKFAKDLKIVTLKNGGHSVRSTYFDQFLTARKQNDRPAPGL